MTPQDREYFRRRAEAERALARASPQPKIAAIHEELAGHYEKLAGCGVARPRGAKPAGP